MVNLFIDLVFVWAAFILETVYSELESVKRTQADLESGKQKLKQYIDDLNAAQTQMEATLNIYKVRFNFPLKIMRNLGFYFLLKSCFFFLMCHLLLSSVAVLFSFYPQKSFFPSVHERGLILFQFRWLKKAEI